MTDQERQSGVDFSAHQQSRREFQFFRTLPEDHGLARLVQILVARQDRRARQLCAEFLQSLPWGEDRLATATFLDGLIANPLPDMHAQVCAALAVRQAPSALRIQLWQAFSLQDDPGAVAGLVADLAAVEDEHLRVKYLGTLHAWLVEASNRKVWLDPPTLFAALRQLPVWRWHPVYRGALHSILVECLPEFPAKALCRRGDRKAFRIARLYQTYRIEHMSMMITLPLLAVFAWGYILLLAWVAGPSLFGAGSACWLVVGVMAVAASSIHTHFSFRETLSDHYRGGLRYFGGLLGFVILVAGLHLAESMVRVGWVP